jgi:hypothetical protein
LFPESGYILFGKLILIYTEVSPQRLPPQLEKPFFKLSIPNSLPSRVLLEERSFFAIGMLSYMRVKIFSFLRIPDPRRQNFGKFYRTAISEPRSKNSRCGEGRGEVEAGARLPLYRRLPDLLQIAGRALSLNLEG